MAWPWSRRRPLETEIGERRAGGDGELVGHQVAAGDGLGDRVLDLEPGVHLEEEELAVIGQQHLDRAGIDVTGGDRRRQRGRAHPLAEIRRDRWRRRFLDDLLVAPLRRAVALAEMDPTPGRVEEDLHLDVARALEKALQDEPIVAEGPMRLAARAGQRLVQVGWVADDAHALPAATGRGLHEERVADAPPLGGEGGVLLLRAVVARDGRDAVGGRAAAGLRLVAHGRDRVGRWSHPAQPGGGHRPGEVGILGEEAIAGVDGIGAGA